MCLGTLLLVRFAALAASPVASAPQPMLLRFGDCLSGRGLKSKSADRWLKSEVPAGVAHWQLLSS